MVAITIGSTDETRNEVSEEGLAGLSAIMGEERMLGTLVRVIRPSKQALESVMLEIGRILAERLKLIEREEVTGPNYYNRVRPHTSL